MPLTITLRGRVLLTAMLSLCTIPSLCIAGDDPPRPQNASQEPSTGKMQDRGVPTMPLFKNPPGSEVNATTTRSGRQPASTTLPYRDHHDDAMQMFQPGRLPGTHRAVSQFVSGREPALRVRADQSGRHASPSTESLQLPDPAPRNRVFLSQPSRVSIVVTILSGLLSCRQRDLYVPTVSEGIALV